MEPRFTGRYHPDYEFGLRCHKAGLRGVFDAELAAWHLFERTPEQFARDCRRQGAAHVLLQRLHPDLLGAPAQFDYGDDLRFPSGAVVRAARRRRLYASLSALLLGSAVVCDRLRLYGVSKRVAFVLKRLENQEGALAVVNGRADAELVIDR